MLLGIVAALLLQEFPQDNRWAPFGPAAYTPVGLRAGTPPTDCFINILPTTDFKGSGEEWQEAVWKDVCRDVKNPPERTTGTAGAFAFFTTANESAGTKRWFTFYTAVAEGRAYLVVFVATSEALYRAHGAAAQAYISKARPGPAPVAGGLRYRIPPGWMARDGGAGTVQFIPPDLPAGGDASIVVLPPQPSQVPADSAINEFVFNKLFMNAADRGHQDGVTGSMGGFRTANAVSTLHRFGIYAARWGTSVQMALFITNSPELFNRYGPAVERMIRTTEVPGFKPDPMAWKPTPLPPPERDVKILGAWLGTGFDTRYSVDPKAGGVASRNYREVLVLFENGIASRTDVVNSGLRDTTYVSQGFATMDVAGLKEPFSDRRFGRWTEENGTITLQMAQGKPLKLTRDGENLKGDWNWTRLQPIDGLRPAGTYFRQGAIGEPQTLTFKGDGSFESSRANEIFGGSMVNPDFPVFGRGSYELRKWSLILRFDTGYVVSINILMDPGPEPKKFLLNGYSFEKNP
jgi:hypothetical protein